MIIIGAHKIFSVGDIIDIGKFDGDPNLAKSTAVPPLCKGRVMRKVTAQDWIKHPDNVDATQGFINSMAFRTAFFYEVSVD